MDSTWQDVPPQGNPSGVVDFFQPGGIYRDVSLRVVPEVFIADAFAKPTNVLSASPGLDVQFTIDAAATPHAPVTLTATLSDGPTQLASASETITITAPGSTVATVSIEGLSGLTLWSPDTPKLYQVSARIVAERIAHTKLVTTGFRQAEFQDDGFYLNGQRLEIFGLNRHQLFPYTGMAAAARLQWRDAQVLRNELNCNMVRCSHYPQSPHFLDACDKLGLMVWQEPPGWIYMGESAFQQIVYQNVWDMVVRDRNRPSVIVWATRLNETGDSSSTYSPSLYAVTRQLAYALDGSRQTTGAMSTRSMAGWAENVFAYDDYHSTYSGNATLEPPLANVPYIVSEAVGALDGLPGPHLYRWVDTEQTLARQALMHARVHNIAQSQSPQYGQATGYSAGLLGWAGIDYASSSGGPDRNWMNMKWAGVLDTFRVGKFSAGVYRSQLPPSIAPVVVPMFFWDIVEPNGPGAGAMIATNCDQLELHVGGQLVASGTPDTQHFGSLAYPPVFVDLTVSGTSLPDLRIDGYVSGRRVASVQMSADTTRDRLSLVIEDGSILGDGTDTTRAVFRATDAYGNQRPQPGGNVTLALTGQATLIGDNPFSFATYGGVGAAFIRSQPGTSGSVSLTASHPTLGSATRQLQIIPATVPVWG